MRVLLVTPFYPPGVAGSVRMVIDTAEHLRKSGATVDVLATTDITDPAVREYDSKQSCRIERLGHGKIPGTTMLRMLLRLLRMLSRGKYDVILCGSAQPVVYPVYVATRLLSVPYVILTFGEDLQDVGLGSRKRKLLVRGLAACHKIIPISSYTASLATGLHVSSDKIVVVHPGIDPEAYVNVASDEALALKERLGLSNRNVILTLARLDERKGHDTVLKALPAICKRVPNAHYLIVGKGDPSRLCTMAAELGVKERVTIVNYVQNDELPALFAMADVHVLISRQEPSTGALEGFGICYLEAAACGKPSISGNIGGPADAVVDGVTGYHVDVLDSEAVADHVVSLLTDPGLAEQLGQAGRQMVLDRFTKTSMVNGIGAVVHEAAAA